MECQVKAPWAHPVEQDTDKPGQWPHCSLSGGELSSVSLSLLVHSCLFRSRPGWDLRLLLVQAAWGRYGHCFHNTTQKPQVSSAGRGPSWQQVSHPPRLSPAWWLKQAAWGRCGNGAPGCPAHKNRGLAGAQQRQSVHVGAEAGPLPSTAHQDARGPGLKNVWECWTAGGQG